MGSLICSTCRDMFISGNPEHNKTNHDIYIICDLCNDTYKNNCGEAHWEMFARRIDYCRYCGKRTWRGEYI